MNDQSERFAIIPVEGKSPAESIVVGPMSEVMSYIRDTIPRREEEQRLARAQRDAVETERFHDEIRTRAFQILGNGLTRLGERIDAYETRKQERADELEREKEKAALASLEEELAALPDPDNPKTWDNPIATGDDGDLEAIVPPPDTEKLDPEHRNEAATGATPNELDKGAPPQPGDYLSTTPPESPYRTPASIGLT
jgi:hypothetical protein